MIHTHPTLQKIGLSEKQSAVYLAALELGEATITDIARKAELKRPTVYLIIEELEIMGLVATIRKGARRIYMAQHPQRLLEILHSRERQVAEGLPDLIALYNTPKDKPKIQVFEGKAGVELIYNEMFSALGQKQEALFFTDVEMLLAKFPDALRDYQERLREIRNPRVRDLHFSNPAGLAWAGEMEKFMTGNTHYAVRLLPLDYEIGTTDNLIFGSKFVIFSHTKDIFVILIDSEEIAKTYRILFECAWKCASPLREFKKGAEGTKK